MTWKQQRDWYRNIFLKGAYWTGFSRAYRDKHPVCERCHRKPSQQVHHLKAGYENLGFEGRGRGLVLALCVPCHKVMDRERKAANTVKKPLRTIARLRDSFGRFMRKSR